MLCHREIARHRSGRIARAFVSTCGSSGVTPPEGVVDFGSRTVAAADKQAMVAEVFDRVAPNYDKLNDLMSLGVHRLWKDLFVDGLDLASQASVAPLRILDVAGGTGDIAFRCISALRSSSAIVRPTHRITIADINPAMLNVGKQRAEQRGLLGAAADVELDFLEGNAEHLDTIEQGSIDLYTIAFGLRNVTDKQKALDDAYRTLKRGGLFSCMEFSRVQNPVIDAVYQLWSTYAIPELGEMFANDRPSYQYLIESIRKFPDQSALSSMMEQSGFVNVSHRNLSSGIVAIHTGFKL